jgi:hypothetical protein
MSSGAPDRGAPACGVSEALGSEGGGELMREVAVDRRVEGRVNGDLSTGR